MKSLILSEMLGNKLSPVFALSPREVNLLFGKETTASVYQQPATMMTSRSY